MKRDDRRLDEEAGHEQPEGDGHQSVQAMAVQRHADLGEIERPGAAVEQGNAEEHEKATDGVGDAEVERALQRRACVAAVGGQRDCGDRHQLEEDEHVEQVAALAEAHDRRHEHEHQRREGVADGLEVPPGEHERGDCQHAAEAGQAGAEGIDRERDPQRDSVVGTPTSEPGDDLAVADGERQLQGTDDRGGERRRHRDPLGDEPPGEKLGAGEQRGGHQRNREGEWRQRRAAHAR